ncbi:hypothetical protein FOA52_006453 [Chlamydomonas sp. UWO 241]|nr:hypothetical protein FOA52_006453 [Chlamydomonas sp. UWO 241]
MAAYLGGSTMRHIPPLSETCQDAPGGGTSTQAGCYKPPDRVIITCRTENRQCTKERLHALYLGVDATEGRAYGKLSTFVKW